MGDVTDVAPRLTVAEADEEQLKAVNLLVSRGSSEAGALELVGAIGAAAVFTKLEEPA